MATIHLLIHDLAPPQLPKYILDPKLLQKIPLKTSLWSHYPNLYEGIQSNPSDVDAEEEEEKKRVQQSQLNKSGGLFFIC